MNDHAGSGPPAAGSRGGSPGRPRVPLPTRVDALPRLADAYDRVLDAGLDALPVVLSPTARGAIAGHARLLLAWNDAINLTSITDPEAVALLHVVDSLTAVPWLIARSATRQMGGSVGEGRSIRLLDLGSGGGYPGIPIAIAIPGIRVVLVDSTAKKARFLQAAVDALDLTDRVSVKAQRAEQVADDVRAGRIERFDVVTARAVAGLADLVELALPLLEVGGSLVAWKRGDLDRERDAARRAAAAIGGAGAEIQRVDVPGLDGHQLVIIEKRRPTPAGYPRDPARRRAAPW